MIGKVCWIVTPYYDSSKQRNSFKSRPALIIGAPDSGDYNILPISRVTIKSNLDANYDLQIDPAKYPLLNLKSTSYIRVHKQTCVHMAAVSFPPIGDMKTDYPDLFLHVMEKLEEYNEKLINNAL